MHDTDAMCRKLTAASVRKSGSTLSRVHYPEALDRNRLVFPERLLSLYHHPIYQTLTDDQRWRLALLETASFFSLNIHGEKALIAEFSLKLYKNKMIDETSISSEYLQHFIAEENVHTHMLASYCLRYAGQVMPDVAMRIAQPELSPAAAHLLFYLRVYVLESFFDFLNVQAAGDDGIDPTTAAVHRLHHLDEARHLAFDLLMLERLRASLPATAEAELAIVREHGRNYARYALGRLYNPFVYRAVGIALPLEIARQAQQQPQRQAVEIEWLQRQRSRLASLDL